MACLPVSFQRVFSPEPTRLILQVSDGEILALHRDAEGTRRLGRCSLQVPDAEILLEDSPTSTWDQVVVRLPAGEVLSRTLSLPAAAEANLHQVVGFELDRFTPFTPEQVYYDARVVERNPATKRLQVALTVALRPAVDSLLERIAGMGIQPHAISVIDGDDSVNLLPPEKRPRKNGARFRLQWILVALLLVLVLAVAAVPLWQQRTLVISLLPKVDAAQVRAERVLALRKQLESSIESAGFLVQKKQQTPLAIDIIGELTRILPDNTYVEQLNLKDGTVQVRGQSQQASALIGLVERSELFRNVTFLSPVTADRRTGRDRFFLSAQIVRES